MWTVIILSQKTSLFLEIKVINPDFNKSESVQQQPIENNETNVTEENSSVSPKEEIVVPEKDINASEITENAEELSYSSPESPSKSKALYLLIGVGVIVGVYAIKHGVFNKSNHRSLGVSPGARRSSYEEGD